MKSFFLCICLASSALFAGSLRLSNNSPYKLRAIVHAADGTPMGSVEIPPNQVVNWSDENVSYGSAGKGYTLNPPESVTPFSVHWHCMDGGEYGISSYQSTGATVTAQSSVGARFCKPPKKKKDGEKGDQDNDNASSD